MLNLNLTSVPLCSEINIAQINTNRNKNNYFVFLSTHITVFYKRQKLNESINGINLAVAIDDLSEGQLGEETVSVTAVFQISLSPGCVDGICRDVSCPSRKFSPGLFCRQTQAIQC